MKCQILSSGKNKKKIESGKRIVKVKRTFLTLVQAPLGCSSTYDNVIFLYSGTLMS